MTRSLSDFGRGRDACKVRQAARPRGAVLLLLLLILGVLGASFAVHTLRGQDAARESQTSQALARAKQALIGYAVTYRDSHAGELSGYLPLPDLGSSRNNNLTPAEGNAAANFSGNGTNRSVAGRLPWKTLELAALRDGRGECLWYAVSGAFQNVVKSTPMNWDSLGQFDPYASQGTPASTLSTVGSRVHQRPIAAVMAPGARLPGQDRSATTSDAVTECGGNYDAANYLDSVSPTPLIANIVNYLDGIHHASGTYPVAAPKQLALGPVLAPDGSTLVNDRLLTLGSDELFREIKKRRDFKTDIDTLLGDVADHLNSLTSLPATSPGNKGIDLVIGGLPAWSGTRGAVLDNWKNNLLYARPAGAATVNGTQSCAAVLLFAGERTQRSLAPLGEQVRATPEQTGSATAFGDPAMYLEGPNTLFPASGAYAGTGFFDARYASADLVRCIKGLPAGSSQQSFARDFANFTAAGSGVTPDVANQSVRLVHAAGTVGGCLWSPSALALAGKTLRAYHEFSFTWADNFALSGLGADRGNGFTLQLITADVGAAPDHCGTAAAMGALGPSDPWGSSSILIETDVHHDAGDADPVQNHSAILLNGRLAHNGPGDSMSPACDGSAAGCQHSPANRFEESVVATHSQRIEVHSGCNADCSACHPATHGAPNDHLRATVWVDCTDCNSVVDDLDRLAQRPTLQRCISPNAALNAVYYGFTAGFRTGAREQGVSLRRLIVRSE